MGKTAIMQVGPVINAPIYARNITPQVQATERAANATLGRPGASVTGGAAHVEEVRNAQGILHPERPNRVMGGSQADHFRVSQRNDAADDSSADDTRDDTSRAVGPTGPEGEPLSQDELRLLDQLKATDRAVRQHELAHQIVGGQYSGGARYEYETGPDGQRYAVAGEVPIDYGPVKGDAQATIDKMQTVIAAALAPADPSPKDLQVAAQARQTLLAAKLDLARERSEMNAARQGGEDDAFSDSESRVSRLHPAGRDDAPLKAYDAISRAWLAGEPTTPALRAVA